MIADQATPATLTSALTVADFKASLNPFRLSANRRWQVPRSPGPNLQARASELIRSPGFPISALLFLGQRSDRIALPLGKCRAGRVPLFSRCSLRVSGTLWDASHLPDFLASRSSFNRSLSLRKSPWLINQNPEPPNSPSISRVMPGCGLNHFTSRWDLGRRLKPLRPFSISSRPRIRSIPLPSSAWKRKSNTPFTFSNP